MGDLHAIRQFLASEGILMSFHGPFRHGILEELGRALRKHLESESTRKPDTTDVFSVYIEAAQNVANYANRHNGGDPAGARFQQGVVVIGRQGDHHIVQCGNFILPADGPALLARLDHLSGLDAAALKTLFKERIRADVEPGAPGAGLGLIRMARIASRPLGYAIVPGEDGLDFFSLTVIL